MRENRNEIIHQQRKYVIKEGQMKKNVKKGES
jgi:hypothetical protein